jgi:hypothetical protein
MMDDSQVVRPRVDRMEDLQWNPALLAEFERQERLGIGDGHPPAPSYPHTPHAPYASQPPTAQRRRNQQTQPRDRAGKYAEKPGSKWKQHLPGGSGPVAPTSLKRQRTPARPTSRRSTANVVPHGKRTQTPLPSMAAMEHAHPLAKVHWWVTHGFRRWRRRKMTALKAWFSLKG